MRLTRPAAVFAVALTALSLTSPASAAQRQPAAEAAAASATATGSAQTQPASTVTADETRRELEELLRQYPPSLPRILRLDPSLLGNPAYLQPYPALAALSGAAPRDRAQPGILSSPSTSEQRRPAYRLTAAGPRHRHVAQRDRGFTIGTVMLLIASRFLWLIKTLIEHRRWSRLSKIQTDVHNKLLDRFSSRTRTCWPTSRRRPGKRFLESAPIPLDSPRSINAPLGRILWSAQAGAVLTVARASASCSSRRTRSKKSRRRSRRFGVVIIALGSASSSRPCWPMR